MKHLLKAVTVIAVATVTIPASAAGLLDKLPADGSKAVYNLKMESERGGMTMTVEGAIEVSSVGKSKVDGKDCRWIEVMMAMSFNGMERKYTAKLLVPESEFGTGKNPMAHIKKGWLKRSDREATEIKPDDPRSMGPLPVFFPGPLSDVKKLTASKIKTGLGELDCKGTSGKREIEQGPTKLNVTYTTRLTSKSPFGVAYSKMEVKQSRDGKERPATNMEVTLKSVSKNAKSTLPDKK